jgi:hypothetical protein
MQRGSALVWGQGAAKYSGVRSQLRTRAIHVVPCARALLSSRLQAYSHASASLGPCQRFNDRVGTYDSLQACAAHLVSVGGGRPDRLLLFYVGIIRLSSRSRVAHLVSVGSGEQRRERAGVGVAEGAQAVLGESNHSIIES